MRVDIYRRPEDHGKYQFLAVPESHMIPEEATNTDWVIEARGVEVDDKADKLEPYSIDKLCEQITEKGYAVTSVLH